MPNQAPARAAAFRPSLPRVFWLTFAPSALVFAVGFTLILTMVGRVHTDVQRMFEETREVDLVRSLLDELRGIESWVYAAPTLSADARNAADADARQHLDTAIAIVERFEHHGADPSEADHEASEDQLLRTIQIELPLLMGMLADPIRGLEEAEPHVDSALRAAVSLANSIQQESHELGANLDQSSEDIVHLVLLLGAVATATLVLAALLLHRRILRPLARLRDRAQRLGEGDFGAPLTMQHRDELGMLAETLEKMAGRVRAQQSDLEARVEQRTRELLRTARLADLGTLAAGVAHEINNPLAAIATCAEGLLRDPQGEGVADENCEAERARNREYLEIIAKEAMRARDTTQRLLAFARPESGRREAVWLDRELAEVAKMLEHSAMRAGVQLVVDAPRDTPPTLGDPADLRQVLFNLLKNAIDASPRGTTVNARLSTRDERVILHVLDHGHGIAEGMSERIFEPFVTTKDPGLGTGLGLPISHRIVTDHNGHMSVENRTGGGACFTVDLPQHG